MVPVPCDLGQYSSKVLNHCIAILAGTIPCRPLCLQPGTRTRADRRGGRMTLRASRIQENLRHVAILRDRVGQAIELVAPLDVMGTGPAALEERHILVELVVLAGIASGERGNVGSSGCTTGCLQGGRQGITCV